MDPSVFQALQQACRRNRRQLPPPQLLLVPDLEQTRLDIRVINVVREIAGNFNILVVPIGAHSFIALLAILLPQCIWIKIMLVWLSATDMPTPELFVSSLLLRSSLFH